MNIHFDNPLQSLTKHTLTSLSLYNLFQFINKPTHKCCHIIDWVVVRPDNDIYKKLLLQTLESDNYCICSSRGPSILNLASTAYATSSHLVIGNETILSETGVQLGPVLFALAVDEIARSVRSPINIWYLDDATIGGPAESVCEDLRRIIPMLSDIGLEVNPTKSEVSNVSCDNFQSVVVVSTPSRT